MAGEQTPLLKEAPPEGEATVRGVVRNVTYRTPDGNFSVVRLTSVDGKEITVVGPLGDLAEGEPVRIAGKWESHSAHGPQLKAHTVVPELPGTPEGIRRLLGSGFVSGIGPEMAHRIVERFASSTLDVIADHPERLQEVGGIGKKRALSIQSAFAQRRAEVEGKAFMQALGIGPAMARRVWDRFGVETHRVLKENPYRLAEEVAGIGFLTADKIGRAVGIDERDPRRIAACALYLLLEAVEEGHAALPPEELAVSADKFGIEAALIREAIVQLKARGMIVVDRDLVYPPPLFNAEVHTARRVIVMVRDGVTALDRAVLYGTLVRDAVAHLNARQREAVEATLTAPVLALTGGPGTGKTTTVRAMVTLQRASGQTVLLAAPTGRAAKRLNEATKHPASTIHRLLEWTPRLQRFLRNANSPLEADFVLVDEASMLDIQLAAALLNAVRPGARLVFVGDADQLPPVGPGAALADLLATPEVRVVRLTEVFRQASASAIVRGAYEVLRGLIPKPSPSRAAGHDTPSPPAGELYFLKSDEAPRAAELLVEMVARRIPKSFGVDPVRDVQVLVPTHRGPLGAQALNLALQEALNPSAPRGRRGFAQGDKVMQLKNDYDLDVWNGDIGTVVASDEKSLTVNIDGRDVVYTGQSADHLVLAYAATVHKSQGSEYDVVVIGLHTSHFVLLNRALLYTAITRARRLVVLIGSERAMRMAVQNDRVLARYGSLRDRLRDGFAATADEAQPGAT